MGCCGRNSFNDSNNMGFTIGGDSSSEIPMWITIGGVFLLIVFLIWFFVLRNKEESTSTEEEFRKIDRVKALARAKSRRLVR